MGVDNEFFKKLDKDIEKHDEKKKEEIQESQEEDKKIQIFIEKVIPKLEEYKNQLIQRGVKVTLEHTTHSFTFMMYYSDGGHHGLRLQRKWNRKFYMFESMFTDEGKNYLSEGGALASQVEKSWSWEDLKNLLQEEINNFFFYADRHGGFK
jgi:hypothetical protein